MSFPTRLVAPLVLTLTVGALVSAQTPRKEPASAPQFLSCSEFAEFRSILNEMKGKPGTQEAVNTIEQANQYLRGYVRGFIEPSLVAKKKFGALVTLGWSSDMAMSMLYGACDQHLQKKDDISLAEATGEVLRKLDTLLPADSK